MRSLAGSLADGVLAEAILIPPCPPIPPTNIRMVGVLEKKYGKLVSQKTFPSNLKKDM